MKIIDAHTHLDDVKFPNVFDAAGELSSQVKLSDVDAAIVLHLEAQNWSMHEFSEAINEHENIHGFVNVHPANPDAKKMLREAVNDLGYIGLKLHPRLQKFQPHDVHTIDLVRYAGELGIPVLLDAFPDGTHLMADFDPLQYATLAKEAPLTKIIWAHMGGHHVIDFMMLAKRLDNVYFDISYSFLYFRGSDVPKNMAYAMKSMRYDRVFYGSDYPDRSIQQTLKDSIALFDQFEIDQVNQTKILSTNAEQFFSI